MIDTPTPRTKMTIGADQLAEALTYWLNMTRFRPAKPVKVLAGQFVCEKHHSSPGLDKLTLEYDPGEVIADGEAPLSHPHKQDPGHRTGRVIDESSHR